jgi:glycosyltransferase involved in cell wall biosynthesis
VILGIDAHCIRGDGGSITHLREALRVADPAASGFSNVVLWSNGVTLGKIEDRPWLRKAHEPALDAGLLRRTYWSAAKVSRRASDASCDVLWVPGCSFAGSFRPYVAMSRNMVPFEWAEMCRFGLSRRFLKFLLLRFSQSRTYRHSNGMIYLSEYARAKVSAVMGRAVGDARVIPHGIDARFANAPKPDTAAVAHPKGRLFKLLYVSAVDAYKHQWRVVEAVEQLQRQDYTIELTLVGHSFPEGETRLRLALTRFRGTPGSVKYVGAVRHEDLHRYYQDADIFVYASSCENFPNILLEAMASGTPIASSARGPMPEILKDGGVYFDPENSSEIASAVRQLIESPALRQQKAELGLRYSRAYSWERCASESFQYLAEVASRYRASTMSTLT